MVMGVDQVAGSVLLGKFQLFWRSLPSEPFLVQRRSPVRHDLSVKIRDAGDRATAFQVKHAWSELIGRDVTWEDQIGGGLRAVSRSESPS